MEATKDLPDEIKVHPDGECLTGVARERVVSVESRASDTADEVYVKASLRGCGRRDAVSMVDDAERSEKDSALKCDKPTKQLQQESTGLHKTKQDTRPKSGHAGFFHETLISQFERDLTAAQKADQRAESSYNAAKAQLKTDISALIGAGSEFRKQLLEGATKDSIHRSKIQLPESEQAIGIELDQMIAMEQQASLEKGLAATECWRKYRNTVEANLRTVEQKTADFVKKIEEERAEYTKKLSDYATVRNLALKEKDVAVLQKLSLAEDLALERNKVAEMEKTLEAKDRVIADADDNAVRITLRLQEEIVDKERAQQLERVLAAQLGQTLMETSREISDLQEKLAIEQSTATKISEEKNLLTTKLAQEVTAHQKLQQDAEKLSSEAQKLERELSVSQDALKASGDLNISFEKLMREDIKSGEQSIEMLENANRTLKAQLESYNERRQHMHQRCYAANRALNAVREAKLGLEKDLHTQNTLHVEEMKQARYAAEQARTAKDRAMEEMKSMKEDLERKLTEQAATNALLEKEHKATTCQLTESRQLRVILRDTILNQHREMSARLQEELALKEQAQQQLANVRGNLCTLRLKESEAKVLLERECKALKDERSELHRALAKAEKDTSDQTARLVGHLRAADIDARDQRTKRERAEQELRVWREYGGVIALD